MILRQFFAADGHESSMNERVAAPAEIRANHPGERRRLPSAPLGAKIPASGGDLSAATLAAIGIALSRVPLLLVEIERINPV